MRPLVEAIQLSKVYPDGTHALRDVTCSIYPGEFVAIMGPSGSGKSTLLHILGFLDPQTSGVYRFNGKKLSELTQKELACIRNEALGFVFQQFNLMPRQTVIENVCMPLYYSSLPRKEWKGRAEGALTHVGLAHRLTHEAYMLSGGEKQRVAIARALINEPKLIFADEPTGNLDSKAGAEVIEIVKGLHRAGRTIVLITHDQKIADHAKRTLYIEDGRLIRDSEHPL